jgi:hypothetical protein
MIRLVVVVSAKKSVGAGRGSALTVAVTGGVAATGSAVTVGAAGIGVGAVVQLIKKKIPSTKTHCIHPRIDLMCVMPHQWTYLFIFLSYHAMV